LIFAAARLFLGSRFGQCGRLSFPGLPFLATLFSTLLARTFTASGRICPGATLTECLGDTLDAVVDFGRRACVAEESV